MKIVEEVLTSGLTWEETTKEMNENYAYITKDGCNKSVLLTDEEGNIFSIDGQAETVICIANTPSFSDSTYSTVRITSEALASLKANLY